MPQHSRFNTKKGARRGHRSTVPWNATTEAKKGTTKQSTGHQRATSPRGHRLGQHRLGEGGTRCGVTLACCSLPMKQFSLSHRVSSPDSAENGGVRVQVDERVASRRVHAGSASVMRDRAQESGAGREGEEEQGKEKKRRRKLRRTRPARSRLCALRPGGIPEQHEGVHGVDKLRIEHGPPDTGLLVRVHENKKGSTHIQRRPKKTISVDCFLVPRRQVLLLLFFAHLTDKTRPNLEKCLRRSSLSTRMSTYTAATSVTSAVQTKTRASSSGRDEGARWRGSGAKRTALG